MSDPMSPCKQCKVEVPVSSEKCPECGVDWPGLTRRDRVIAVGILGVLVVGLVWGGVALFGGDEDQQVVQPRQRTEAVGIEAAVLSSFDTSDVLEQDIIRNTVAPCWKAIIDRNYDPSMPISKEAYAAMVIVGTKKDDAWEMVRELYPMVRDKDRDQRRALYDLGRDMCIMGAQ